MKKAEKGQVALKSDYFRIEIVANGAVFYPFTELKSDYFRIEISHRP
ncbi:MAG: hypothetical protein PWQ15_1375 [Methanobacterium sp.]|nr:hypothetical protein [Methanobacterium sp.]